ncbi:helix-turn-helix domain-containing protein [Mycobacterium sp. NAZ190054]|uniref:helix-turn-helix domain-containing protein n=1 Tax=Mycobacterium sp. NAZ190054 TaxID=1747766 RepID=UPI0012E397B7|nr:helix-turn-helix domain-containing protein [Mycobacterium sp. NAZ190054]
MSRTSPTLPRAAINSRQADSRTDCEAVDSIQEMMRTTVAAKRLQISSETLRRYVVAGLIPAVRVGPKLLMFDPNEVDKLARTIDNRTASA